MVNTWKKLPIVSISDLIIDEKSGDLIAATHGRGIYKLNLNPIHYLIKKGGSKEQNILFPLKDVNRPLINDTHKEPISSTAEKLSISFFINKDEKVLTEVFNDKNDLIWSCKFDAKKGYNEFRWDIIYEKNQSELPYFIHYNKYLPAGNYKLNLKLSDENFEETFDVYNSIIKTRILIFFLIFVTTNILANEKYLLNEGDSLFKLRKYVDAKKIYENLYYEKNYFSDAMLLKLSFIEEGIGNYEKALIYLSKHYYHTHNKETSTKIKSIAKKNELIGLNKMIYH